MSGVKWKIDGDEEVIYVVDSRLMVGAPKSPSVFHMVTRADTRFTEKRGIRWLHIWMIIL